MFRLFLRFDYVSLRRGIKRTRLFFWSEVVVNLTTTLREHFVALIEIEMNLIIKFNPENKCKFPALSSQFNKNNYYDTGTCFL